MRDGVPSMTALGVALLRGIASAPGSPFRDVDDPVARTLLPRPLALLPALAGGPIAQPILRVLSGGLLDHVALRTGAIDDELRIALDEGITQLVILGAGLDARAWRMRELSRATVFEVDIVQTQRMKRARLEDRAPLARDVRFVTVDFGKGELDARLADAGHDPANRTVWIWEGVMPYLPRAAARATLETIAARSAPRSTLLVTYVTPEHVRISPRWLPAVKRGFALIGEPLIGALDSVAMHALLGETGFVLENDAGSPEWARAHLRRGRPWLEITERLAVARRR